MANMNHNKNLHTYVENLVSDYSTYDGSTYNLFFHDLPTEEQGELARLYLETTDRETTECVHGNDFSIDNNYTCALLALLKEDTQENKERFAEVTRNNVITHYEDILQKIINQACNNYLHTDKSEQGLSARHCPDNGEIYFSRY